MLQTYGCRHISYGKLGQMRQFELDSRCNGQ
jgi:hypothetical protein